MIMKEYFYYNRFLGDLIWQIPEYVDDNIFITKSDA